MGETHQAHRGRPDAASPGHWGAGAGHHLPACLPAPWPPLRAGTRPALPGGPLSGSARHRAGGPSRSLPSLPPGRLCLLLLSGRAVWQRVGCEVLGVGLGDAAVVLFPWKSVLLCLCPEAPRALLSPTTNHERSSCCPERKGPGPQSPPESWAFACAILSFFWRAGLLAEREGARSPSHREKPCPHVDQWSLHVQVSCARPGGGGHVP